jgi:hypothetical protein
MKALNLDRIVNWEDCNSGIEQTLAPSNDPTAFHVAYLY